MKRLITVDEVTEISVMLSRLLDALYPPTKDIKIKMVTFQYKVSIWKVSKL